MNQLFWFSTELEKPDSVMAQHIPPSGGLGFHGHDCNYRRGLPTLRYSGRRSSTGRSTAKPTAAQLEPEPEPEPVSELEPQPEPVSEPEPEPELMPVETETVNDHVSQMVAAGGHFVYVDVTKKTTLFVVESDTPDARNGLAVGESLEAGGRAMMLYPMHTDSDGNVFMRTRTVNRENGTMRDFWAMIQPCGAEQTVTNFRTMV